MVVICLHQLHDNLRSLRFQASLIVLLLFFVGNGVVYSYKMDRAAEEIVRTSRSDEGRYDAVETLDQAVSAGYKIRVAEAGVEFIVEAGSDWFPYGMNLSPQSGNTVRLSHARTVNYFMRTFEVMDWSVIVRYVLSFLCIVLSYNAISGEREGGTLRLVLANPVSRGEFLMGKFLAHLVTLTVALILGSLISLAILALNQRLELSAAVAGNYLLFMLGAVSYIALFLLLGMGISAVARSSSTSLVILIMTWATLIVIIPQTSYLIAVRTVEPTGSWREAIGEYERQYREVLVRDGVMPRQMELARADGFALEKRYAVRLREMESELDRMMREAQQRDIRQFQIARAVNLLSPGFAFQYSVEALLGTGIHRYQRFVEEGWKYRDAVREFLRVRDAADPNSPHVLFVAEFMSTEPLDSHLIPRFKLGPVSFADGLAAASVPLTVLFLEGALAFFFALGAFNRTELSAT